MSVICRLHAPYYLIKRASHVVSLCHFGSLYVSKLLSFPLVLSLGLYSAYNPYCLTFRYQNDTKRQRVKMFTLDKVYYYAFITTTMHGVPSEVKLSS